MIPIMEAAGAAVIEWEMEGRYSLLRLIRRPRVEISLMYRRFHGKVILYMQQCRLKKEKTTMEENNPIFEEMCERKGEAAHWNL